MAKYDVVLMEKPDTQGLTKSEINELLDKLGDDPLSVYPVEYMNTACESCAMGFITEEAANRISFEYDNDGPLGLGVSEILGDMTLENPDQTYNIYGLTVLITR